MQYKRCSKCHALKSVDEFYKYKSGNPRPDCIECNNEISRQWHIKNREYKNKISREYNRFHRNQIPMDKNKDCSSFLGVHVAERVLYNVFNNVELMPYGHPGYDFICNNGYKIDVKSSICHKYTAWSGWQFAIRKNKIPDYFLLIAFDNREDLNPLHIWLIPSHVINNNVSVSIASHKTSRFIEYEKDISKVIQCCNVLKATS